MKHPLANNNTYIFYILVWAVVFAAHAAILHFYYQYPYSIAAVDAAVFNGLLAIIGFAFGFAFYYIKTDSTPANTILSYMALILVGASAAYFGADYLLKKVFIDDKDFLIFISEARLWRVSASVFYIGIVLIAYYLILYNQELSEHKESELKLQDLLKQTELDALKSQINPHFIFNSLNSISSLTITTPNKAQEMVIKLSDFLRYSLGNNTNAFSTLEEELSNIGLYLDIEKVRFGDRLEINQEIDAHAKSAFMPNMILQPLFENAMKYGLYESFESVEITTKASLQYGRLVVNITNSYDPSHAVKKGKGIGLKNVRERLRLHYGSNQLLKISTDANKFTATIEVPQQTEPND